MFYRQLTDGSREPFDLRALYAGGSPSACWIVGGGPSLDQLPLDLIRDSPIPKFAINLAGAQRLRPQFWTSYDPTARFHRSVYLDPSILKFVHGCRAMDLIPESTLKVCDAPATLCFERIKGVTFRDFPGGVAAGIVDWQDSLIQAIHLAYLLGFRRLFLIGCDMHIRPAPQLITAARQYEVEYQPYEVLGEFFKRCEQAGFSKGDWQGSILDAQYHFGEEKPVATAIQTDQHYFRISQYLRLSRRGLAQAGLELISATPQSRLNDYFPTCSVAEILGELAREIGDPAQEPTEGLYRELVNRQQPGLGPMRDFPPHGTDRKQAPVLRKVCPPQIPAIPVSINEQPR